MKKIFLCLLIASSMLVACNNKPKDFKTYHYDGQRCYLLTSDEEMWPGGDSLGVENSYSMEWPASGFLTSECEAELLLRCFGDSTATSFSQAADRWLDHLWLYDEDSPALHKHPVDTLGIREHYSYGHLASTVTRDSNLVTMLVTSDTYMAYAAHGLYSTPRRSYTSTTWWTLPSLAR